MRRKPTALTVAGFVASHEKIKGGVGGEKIKVQRAHLGNVDGYVEPERKLGKSLYSDITTADTGAGTSSTAVTALKTETASELKPVDVATVGTAIRVPIWLSEEDRDLKKDALLHRALKLPEGEIIFRQAVTESLSLHCPQRTKASITAATASATDVIASGADVACGTASTTATADATAAASDGTSTVGATSGSSTAMAVNTTARTTTVNSSNNSSSGGAATVVSKLSSMAVDDTTTTTNTTTTTDTTASNNTEGETVTSDSPATVDAPSETQRLPTAPIKEAPQLLLVPGHDCELETFPAGLLFGAAHALPTAFVLERVLLASALRRAADLPCAVADTEAALRRPANERLETLGDAWLKLYMSLVVMQAQCHVATYCSSNTGDLKSCCANDNTYNHTVAETHT
eukprot:11611-Heterococcus_DN1.PRE.2